MDSHREIELPELSCVREQMPNNQPHVRTLPAHPLLTYCSSVKSSVPR